MAALTVQIIAQAGLGPTYAACAAGGDTFANDGRTFLHVKNTNAATRQVTVDADKLCSQGSDHNAVVTVPATTGDRMIGPFPLDQFPSVCAITYDAVTNLTIAAVQLPAR
ncbi:MAG TPA: hypothetical protein VGR28_10640 [Candidatus Thermoplasmatota archaeon]|jgi:hypothetical protein|nr:hypothetical protein [Candidatus Thermoplasmatota archaeon]